MKIFGVMKFPPIYGDEGLKLYDKIMRFLVELSRRYGIKKYSAYYTLHSDRSPKAKMEPPKRKMELEILGVEHLELMKAAHITADRIFHGLLVQLKKPLAEMKIDGAICISSVDDPNIKETIHEISELGRLWEKGSSKKTPITFRAELVSEEGFEKTAQKFLNFARRMGFTKVKGCITDPKFRLKDALELFRSKEQCEEKLWEYGMDKERILELVVENNEGNCLLSRKDLRNFRIALESRDSRALESMIDVWNTLDEE